MRFILLQRRPCNLKMMQEASKCRCNEINFISLSFVSKVIACKCIGVVKSITTVLLLIKGNSLHWTVDNFEEGQSDIPQLYMRVLDLQKIEKLIR